MPRRNLTITAIILLFLGTIIATFTFGPAQRRYVTPGKTVTTGSELGVEQLWRLAGVRGRTAVIFSHHLQHQFLESAAPEMQTDYLDRVMRQGIVRTSHCVVPDRIWPDVEKKYLKNWAVHLIVPPIKTDSGFTVLHEGGRIYFTPLAKYIPEPEQELSLVVIEPAVWSPEDRSRIDGFVKSGQLTADLTVVISAGERSAGSEPL